MRHERSTIVFTPSILFRLKPFMFKLLSKKCDFVVNIDFFSGILICSTTFLLISFPVSLQLLEYLEDEDMQGTFWEEFVEDMEAGE